MLVKKINLRRHKHQKGYGRLLLEHAVKYARAQQYRKICLDTRKQFSVAQHLYRSVGFQETNRYNDNEHIQY